MKIPRSLDIQYSLVAYHALSVGYENSGPYLCRLTAKEFLSAIEKDLKELFVSTRNPITDFRKENINLAGISIGQKTSPQSISSVPDADIIETLLRGIFSPSILMHPTLYVISMCSNSILSPKLALASFLKSSEPLAEPLSHQMEHILNFIMDASCRWKSHYLDNPELLHLISLIIKMGRSDWIRSLNNTSLLWLCSTEASH